MKNFILLSAMLLASSSLAQAYDGTDATVDGVTWETSIWRDTKSNRSLLAVPKKYRGGKGDGDAVTVTFLFDPDDD